MLLHKHPAEDHPEAPRRIAHIFHLLKTSGYVARMVRIASREAKRREIKRVHTDAVVNGIFDSAFLPPETLKENSALLERESSLYLNEYSALCARFSAGSLIEMCDAVVAGRIRNGFAVIRPPGHHAEPNRSMGFCLFNNVAIATRAMQDKYATGENAVKRVMIVDWLACTGPHPTTPLLSSPFRSSPLLPFRSAHVDVKTDSLLHNLFLQGRASWKWYSSYVQFRSFRIVRVSTPIR